MKNTKGLPVLVAVVILSMAIASFSSLFGSGLSSAAIIVGIAFFFVNKVMEKQPMKGSGLDLMAVGEI